MNSPSVTSSSPLMNKRDPLSSSWSAGPDDLKRLPSHDRKLHHPLKHAKSEFYGHGCLDGSIKNLSRLDKARSFAKRDTDATNGGVKSTNSSFPKTGKRKVARNEALEMVEMHRFPSLLREGQGNLVMKNAGKKQERGLKRPSSDVQKASSAPDFERDQFLARKRPYSKHISSSDNSTSTALGHSMRHGKDRPPSKHRVGHGDSILELSKHPTAETDGFKRTAKLKTKPASGIEATDASKDANFIRGRVKVEKHRVCSPSKSNNGSSDELLGTSSLCPSTFRNRKRSSSAETPLLFLHVTRRARSERRRDDSCKSQTSNNASLDGFGAELEEALLRKQEAESVSDEKLVAVMHKRILDAGASTPMSIKAGDAGALASSNETHKVISLAEADEREEGELEPEDEFTEKPSYEARNEVENGQNSGMQGESNSREGDDLEERAAALDCQQWQSDPSTHNFRLSARDHGSHDLIVLEVENSQNAFESVSSIRSDVLIREQKQVNVNGTCKRVADVRREDNEDLSAMDLNAASLKDGGSILNAQQTDTSLHAKDYVFSEQIGLSIPVESPTHKGLKSRETNGLLCSTPFIRDKHTDGDSHTLKNGSDNENSKLDELTVYAHRQKKLKVGSLQLSLALPGCSSSSQAPSKPVEHDISRTSDVLGHQSLSHLPTETMSNELNTSLSLLSSFVHNPRCSLNCISREDQELSCEGSRQTSQRRWANSGGAGRGLCDVNQTTASRLNMRSNCIPEASLYQQGVQNDKSLGCSAGLGAMGLASNQAKQREPQFTSGGRSPARTDRVQIISCQAPAPTLVEKSTFDLKKGKEVESLSNVKLELLEIASEPIAAMAQKLQELPDSFLEGLKGLVKELLGSFAKREEFLALQQIVRRRMDLTEQTLLRAHPTQLEILVALKTGMQSFVRQDAKTLTYKALIEIFLQTRCRNVECQQLLPVDGCECKVCSEKKGFCHECMCMVCSKFDSESNTCRWVGCDVCMHWCHTDCGLRMSHIKLTPVHCNGIELHEMQFQCLSCDHHMELFGFVKGVFENFASTWGAETLASELDCVRRIFHGCEDGRGKQLHWKAEEMLQMLERDVAVHDVCSSMLSFFNEGDTHAGKACPVSLRPMQPRQAINHGEGATNTFATMGSIVARKLSNLVEHKELEGKEMEGMETVEKKDVKAGASQDFHSIIGAKLTDVLIYQAQADAAREDAINLQYIMTYKAKYLEEDYRLASAKLLVHEAEEQQRKCLEELQALERSHHEYEIMKLRIASDMKHLMTKVERSKAQLL